jgi:acetyl esterase/lipase
MSSEDSVYKGVMWNDKKSRTELTSIYSPSITAKPGINTKKLFDQLPQPVAEKLDVPSLRLAIADWDRNFNFLYPSSIAPSDFKEQTMDTVPVSIYRSPNTDTSIPTILLVHGGGFFCELANVHKSLMANIADKIPCHGVLVHYSLAPEVRAPKAISEITSVIKELLIDPKKYGLTENLIIVSYSSGANLTWNALLNIINSSETKELANKISHLFLMSPWADVSMKTTIAGPYQQQQDADKMLQTWGLEQMRDWYLPEGATGEEPLFSPAFRSADDMKGIPKTTVIVGEIDRLLTDAIETTRVLRDAGVPTQLVVLEGQSHNHSCHVGLRDGVFTPDIIAATIRDEPIMNLKGDDGLGVRVNSETFSSANKKRISGQMSALS